MTVDEMRDRPFAVPMPSEAVHGWIQAAEVCDRLEWLISTVTLCAAALLPEERASELIGNVKDVIHKRDRGVL